MPSITTWTRLEPRSRHEDMSAFLHARLADPLWSLAVQWRLGEFIGQDAAFPIATRFGVDYRPLVTDQAPADPQLPFDAVLTAETTATPESDVAAAVDLVDLLQERGVTAQGIAELIAKFSWQPDPLAIADPQGRAWLAGLTARLPDAAALAPVLRKAVAEGALPAALQVSSADAEAILAAAATWTNSLQEAAPLTTTDTWRPETLDHDYTVSVVGADGVVSAAVATRSNGDTVDWYDFDIVTPGAPGAIWPGAPFDPSGHVDATGIPHPLPVPGAPDARYWALEDGSVNVAAMTVDPADLARMLLVEFLTVTAPNWYLQTIELPVGVLATAHVSVVDTFGGSTDIPVLSEGIDASGHPTADWVLFRPRGGAGEAPTIRALLLPAVTADQVRSAPVETVHLVRDDVHDRAWASEVMVEARDGRPFDRVAATFAVAAAPPAPSNPPRYVLETPVPAWAYPMVDAGGAAPAVELAVPDPLAPPLGAFLTGMRGRQIPQEQVPPWQATLTRERRLARGPDGQLLVWTTRVRRLGGTARSFPLEFDRVEDVLP